MFKNRMQDALLCRLDLSHEMGMRSRERYRRNEENCCAKKRRPQSVLLEYGLSSV